MKYKLRNWSQYNTSLVNRGNITFWLSQDAIDGWLSTAIKGRGHPEVYSEAAILTSLILKFVYHLTYRATQGFLQGLLRMMGLPLPVPCYTQMCRRGAKNSILKQKISRKLPTDIVIDSTGLKVYGEGEWKVKKHGQGKRRTWRKIHLALCPDSHEIIAMELTGGNEADCKILPRLIKTIPRTTKRIYADGAYDAERCYRAIWERGIEAIIPPKRGGKYARGAPPWKGGRNAGVLELYGLGGDEEGKKLWKKLKGYHKRSLAETGMYRLKKMLGEGLTSRKRANQETEVRVKVEILNKMTRLGMPKSYAA